MTLSLPLATQLVVLFQEGGVDCVIIDGWIKFRANKRIARLVKVEFHP